MLAQQSIRETGETAEKAPEEVIDAAVWAVFQEGYKNGFGADADHLKTTDDVDRLVKAGFTMFTIDPSDRVVKGVAELGKDELSRELLHCHGPNSARPKKISLHDTEGRTITSPVGSGLCATKREVLEACLKNVAAIINVWRIYNHLKTEHPSHDCEIEVSIDETDSATTPFEHFLIVNELRRLGVTFVSLAPRFVGDFEKGIDYKGNIELLKDHFARHSAIADYFGFYKISFHSGSDKFRIYEAVGAMKRTHIHVKTAGTSYLEALKVVAMKDPTYSEKFLTMPLASLRTKERAILSQQIWEGSGLAINTRTMNLSVCSNRTMSGRHFTSPTGEC